MRLELFIGQNAGMVSHQGMRKDRTGKAGHHIHRSEHNKDNIKKIRTCPDKMGKIDA